MDVNQILYLFMGPLGMFLTGLAVFYLTRERGPDLR
jgi:hypothetical protein